MAGIYFRTADNPKKVSATFYREGRLVGKRCLRHMRKVAKLVMDYSIAAAPRDYKGPRAGMSPGRELERSHKIKEQFNNNRIEATVMVGGMVAGVNVNKYLDFIHNNLTYDLGKASIEKQAENPSIRIGPRFLERALEEYDGEIGEWGSDMLDDLMRGLMI